MTALRDAFGLPLTLSDPSVRDRWDTMVVAFLRHCRSTPEHLGDVLEREPGFAMGWAAKGLFTLLLGRHELVPIARQALTQAEAALDSHGGTPRERAYVAALAAWLGGRPSSSTAIFERQLAATPEDALAMKLDHAIRFLLGDRHGMLRLCEATAPAYGSDHPAQGYALGCRAFALEEVGEYARAEAAGHRAVVIAPDDAWGLHAVAHVYDMMARNRRGIAWLSEQTERWAHCNNFGAHVWWHLALFHLDEGEIDQVLALYDTHVRAEHTDDYRDIANGASMLARLEIEGVDVGNRWQELAGFAAGRVEESCVVFADLHYLLALDGANRDREASRLIDRLARDAKRSDHDMHEVAATAGHPAALGLGAFRAGHYSLAFDKLREVRGTLQKVGGSHAQRDVFSRLMIEAGIRSQRWVEADRELRARAARRGAEDGFTARRLAAISRARAAAVAAE